MSSGWYKPEEGDPSIDLETFIKRDQEMDKKEFILELIEQEELYLKQLKEEEAEKPWWKIW